MPVFSKIALYPTPSPSRQIEPLRGPAMPHPKTVQLAKPGQQSKPASTAASHSASVALKA